MSVTDLDLFFIQNLYISFENVWVRKRLVHKKSLHFQFFWINNIFILSKECWPISPKKDLTLLKGLTRICISSSGSSSSVICCSPRGLYPISGSATCCCCPPCSTTTWALAATSGVSLGLSWIKTREREGGRTTRQLTS